MSRCPNCGTRLFGRTRYHEDLVCPRCNAKLRVKASSRGVPLFLTLLIVALWMFPLTGGFGFFWLFILICCVVPSTQKRVVVVQQSTSTVQQTPQIRDEDVRPLDNTNRQRTLNGQHSLTQGQHASRYCSYCGAAVPISNWRFCANCGASLTGPDGVYSLNRDDTSQEEEITGRCMVCDLELHRSDQVAYCLHCGNAAHKKHLLEWIHIRGQCPVCGQHLTEQDVG